MYNYVYVKIANNNSGMRNLISSITPKSTRFVLCVFDSFLMILKLHFIHIWVMKGIEYTPRYIVSYIVSDIG